MVDLDVNIDESDVCNIESDSETTLPTKTSSINAPAKTASGADPMHNADNARTAVTNADKFSEPYWDDPSDIARPTTSAYFEYPTDR